MLKVFVNGRREPDRIGQFARAVVAGWAERHLAIVGEWRIGKSRLIEHDFESRAPLPVAVLQGTAASTTT